jgi:hypothetical protein
MTNRYTSGTTVQAMVEESDKTFVNDKGKTINYTDRKIMYFMDGKPSQQAPINPTQNFEQFVNTPSQPKPSNADFDTIAVKVSELESRVETLEAFNGIMNE